MTTPTAASNGMEHAAQSMTAEITAADAHLREALAHIALANSFARVDGFADEQRATAVLAEMQRLLGGTSILLPEAARADVETALPVAAQPAIKLTEEDFCLDDSCAESPAPAPTPTPTPTQTVETPATLDEEANTVLPVIEADDQDTDDDLVWLIERSDESQPIITTQPVEAAAPVERTARQQFIDEALDCISRGELPDFVDKRGLISDFIRVTEMFDIPGQLAEGHLGQRLVDVYTEYRGGKFDALLPSLRAISNNTLLHADGTTSVVRFEGQREVMNILLALSPFGFLRNQDMCKLLVLSPGAYNSRLKGLKAYTGDSMSQLIPNQRAIASRITSGVVEYSDNDSTANEGGAKDSDRKPSPQLTQRTNAGEANRDTEKDEDSTAEPFVDAEFGVWDIARLAEYLGDPSADPAKLRNFLAGDYVHADYIPARDGDIELLRLEPAKRCVLNGRPLQFSRPEVTLLNLLVLSPDCRINIPRLQEVGLLSKDSDTLHGEITALIAKLNNASHVNGLLRFDSETGDTWLQAATPIGYKEPTFTRTVRPLSKTPSFLA